MNYIKLRKENPFTLCDFNDNTKFIVRSMRNNYCACHILLTKSHYNVEKECTEVEVIVWESDKGYGRHIISIIEPSNKINMKQLLLEIARTFGKTDIEEEYCYIEVEGKQKFTF